jgi:hypothetical protein
MLADIASPIYSPVYGTSPYLIACSLATFVIIVLIEGVALRLLRWGSWGVALGHAFIINLVTSIIGTGIAFLLSSEFRSGSAPAWFTVVFFCGGFALTVAIEGLELKLLRQSAGSSRIFLNSIVINLFSYAFLGVTMYLALFPPITGRIITGYQRPARHHSHVIFPPCYFHFSNHIAIPYPVSVFGSDR